jgi:hypothetical protein
LYASAIATSTVKGSPGCDRAPGLPVDTSKDRPDDATQGP